MDAQEMKDRGLTPEMVAQPADPEAAPGNFTDQNAEAPVFTESSGESAAESRGEQQ